MHGRRRRLPQLPALANAGRPRLRLGPAITSGLKKVAGVITIYYWSDGACETRIKQVQWRFRDRDPDDNLLEQLQDAGARLRERGRERDDARRERDAARAEVATLRRERDEALRERDAARKQLAARNDMLAQVLKEQQY